VEYKTYAARVEDMLNEYQLLAKGNLELKRLDPVPDTGRRFGKPRRHRGPGVAALAATRFILVWPSVAWGANDDSVSQSGPRALLEYDLTRHFAGRQTQKPVIGV